MALFLTCFVLKYKDKFKPDSGAVLMDIDALLQQVMEHKAPDVHLKVGRPPVIRTVQGDLLFTDKVAALTEADLEAVARAVAGAAKYALFEAAKDVDFSFGAPCGRFRVNLYRDKEGIALAFRAIPAEVPRLEDLGLPSLFADWVMKPRGLILVTGSTGSGKSTTLAAMIRHANEHRKCHIITIEDPIEFVHASAQSLVTQREVNSHTDSFASAIRSALRQDPNVILVGEMRDLETIAAAITLAETGHLVLSTLHTTDAPQTVDRIIDVFPAYQQQQIRAQLSAALLAVISQTLVVRADGNGRTAALEIMVVNDAIRNCIKEGATHQIYSMMQLGRSDGMQTLDDSLAALAAHGVITEDTALAKAHDAEAFRRVLAQVRASLPSSNSSS